MFASEYTDRLYIMGQAGGSIREGALSGRLSQ